MRPAARMLTVGVDTAAAVVNLHMVTRAGLQLQRRETVFGGVRTRPIVLQSAWVWINPDETLQGRLSG